MSASGLLNGSLSLKKKKSDFFLGLSNVIFIEFPSAGLFLFHFSENKEHTLGKTHLSPDGQCRKFLQLW